MNSVVKTIISILVSSFVFTISAGQGISQDDTSDSENSDAGLEAELKWLQAEAVVMTEIATKTKMDADMVPGMVTVLRGAELEKRGIRNVLEALSLVPGLNISPDFIVRGIGMDFASGKVKVLWNNAPVNESMTGMIAFTFYMPIEQLDRIEVIRGPGSALYGKFAYSGVVNIITRQKENRLFGRYGRFDTYSAGGIFSYAAPEQHFDMSLNIGCWRNDQTDRKTGPDILHETGMSDISRAPGPVNDRRKVTTAIMTLSYKELSLLAQLATISYGSGFGIADALPPPNDETPGTDDSHMAEFGWHPEISQSLKLNMKFGWKEYLWNHDEEYLFPPGYAGYENGMIAGPHYEERSLYGESELQWEGWERHLLLLGLEYENIKLTDIWSDSNYHPMTGEPLPFVQRFTGEENWLEEDKSRNIFSLFLQDQFDFTHRLTLTGGLRYDYYDDTKEGRLTPRLAGVFRASQCHIFKIQYAEAFRPPSFMEMYFKNNPIGSGNPDIEAETVKTWELGYVFRSVYFLGRLTVFRSELRNLIGMKDGQYSNNDSAQTKGAELELNWKIFRNLITDVNFSYAKTRDDSTGAEIRGAASWISNIGLVYEPLDNVSLSLQYRYVNECNRDTDDPRDNLDSYDKIDFTAAVRDFFKQGLTFRAGLRNLFDEEIRYSSAYPGYLEDYPQTGRESWFQFSYDFE
ncbi:TonB-dependent receptor plug domain-containing protein [Desulfonema magnum]|uniref:TonB-dependent receptor domain-containing protein n=1 Tax=Desulfonema magnum TaxID=45655 RepID=A0A975GN16_9BACT|nr:TonB-dependent receptor [Desulfonema magnum]QTA87285.1 TonB-dependent receptor domain-containing protein [Desulfonema magnum]